MADSESRLQAARSQRSTFELAFEATAQERAALAPTDLAPINLDIAGTVTIVLGALEQLGNLREEIATLLPTFDLASYDRIEQYAQALAFAQARHLAASPPDVVLPRLAERATALRSQLLADIHTLARRGLVDGRRLAELKGPTGYLTLATDLSVLVRILRDRWGDVQGRSAVEATELDEGDALFEAIMFSYAHHMHRTHRVATVGDDRHRAFTLLVRAYDQARRAATYVRWNTDDTDAFCPSLWAGRGGRGGTGPDGTPIGDA